MKNKKLFAILTLVCFMFTLMPVAAFAADSYKAGQVYVEENGEWVTATEATLAGNPAKATVTVGYTYDGTTPSAAHFFFAENEDGVGVAYADGADLEIKAAGEYTVYAVMGLDSDWEEGFKALDTTADKIAAVKAWAKAEKKLSQKAATVEVVDAEYTYDFVVKKGNTTVSKNEDGLYPVSIKANNGWNEDGEMTVILTAEDADGNAAPTSAIAGKALKITPAGYVDVELAESNYTASNGAVDFTVVSDKAGVYNVTVSYGKAVAKIQVTVTTANLVNVAVNNVPANDVNVDETVQAANVEFKFTDKNGAAFALVDEDADTTSEYKISLTEKPANSKLKAENFTLVKETGYDATGVYTLACTKGDAGFDKEGSYTFVVTLANGATAEATVTAAEQGEPVGIVLVKAPTTIMSGGTANVAKEVRTIDANGVTALIENWESVVTFSVTGKAVTSVKDIDEDDDSIKNINVSGEEDYIGSTITLYAKYGDFIATQTIAVTDVAANIVYKSTEAEAGVTKTLYAGIVDANGKAVVLNGTVVENAIVLDKPEGAVCVAIANYSTTKGVELSLLGSVAGEYTIQTVLEHTDGDVTWYLTSVDTFTVGGGAADFENVVVVSMGANSMIVNNKVVALDVAPFITEGRTMLQFNVLGAFGIDVQWDEATRSVIAEGNGTKVVLTIDSKVATVNGKAVNLDVAPTIANGRTVVPVGFITGNFGIVPTFTYNADGTIADILFTK